LRSPLSEIPKDEHQKIASRKLRHFPRGSRVKTAPFPFSLLPITYHNFFSPIQLGPGFLQEPPLGRGPVHTIQTHLAGQIYTRTHAHLHTRTHAHSHTCTHRNSSSRPPGWPSRAQAWLCRLSIASYLVKSQKTFPWPLLHQSMSSMPSRPPDPAAVTSRPVTSSQCAATSRGNSSHFVSPNKTKP